MQHFFFLLLLASLWTWGWWFIFNNESLLGFVHGWLELGLTRFGEWLRRVLAGNGIYDRLTPPYRWLKQLGEKICKPLFACPPCMASVHGAIFFTLGHGPLSFLWLPVFLVCLCGLNYLLSNLIPE